MQLQSKIYKVAATRLMVEVEIKNNSGKDISIKSAKWAVTRSGELVEPELGGVGIAECIVGDNCSVLSPFRLEPQQSFIHKVILHLEVPIKLEIRRGACLRFPENIIFPDDQLVFSVDSDPKSLPLLLPVI